jgi:hypothetical protein
MDDLLKPQNTVTFRVKTVPQRLAARKTIQRLMRLQPHVQKGLKDLQARRRRHDNRPYIRAGVWWVDRKRATKLTRVDEGAEFTLTIRPQYVPDIKSVSQYLEASSA